MNKFQKDLNQIREQLNSNKEQQTSLKDVKEEKEIEILKLNLESFEIDKLLLDFKMMKNKNRICNKKRNSIKRNTTLLMYVVIILETIFLGLFPTVTMIISVGSIFLSVGLLITLLKVSEKKLNDLFLKQQKLTKKLTETEISERMEFLLLQKNSRLVAVDEMKLSISNIDEKLQVIEKEFARLYEIYSSILETYQSSLLKIEPKISDKETEEILNKEYNENIPVMLKKIYKDKNV